MLQRGIETPDMDVRWVSSLSWYFLNWFGLNGLYRVLLGTDNGMITCVHFHSLAHILPLQLRTNNRILQVLLLQVLALD
jgi:hypothetical protein